MFKIHKQKSRPLAIQAFHAKSTLKKNKLLSHIVIYSNKPI